MLPRAIALLLLLFLLLATSYNVAVPLGEGPDEPGHLAYVLFLAREHRLPVQGTGASAGDVPGEGHQPPLAYLLALPAVLWLPPAALQLELSANPQFLWNDGSAAAAFVRASREYWPWQGLTLAWHLARGISTLLGAITVYCTWRAARRLLPSPAALLAAGLVAFNPQFLFTSALVTNDTLLAALSAALFWLCVAAASDKGHPQASRRALLAGVLLGLALLTKQSALLWLPPLLWLSWRMGGGSLQRTARVTALWGGAALLVAGWWYGRNWLLYGDPLGLADFQASYATQPFDWRNPAAWRGALAQLYSSFWARFGWLSLRPPAWVLWLYSLLMLAALAGLLRRLHQAGRVPTVGTLLRSPWLLVVLLPLLAGAWVLSFAQVAGLVAWQGRFLFPALPALAVLLAWGLTALPLPNTQGIGWRAASLVLGGLALVALALPPGVIAPAYEWHTLPPALAQQRSERSAYARYAQEWERGIELCGWRVSSGGSAVAPGEAVPAGTPVSVTLTWHALERVPENWTVFLHLVDAEGDIVAEHNSIPQQGQMPLPHWTPGDWLEDTHPLTIPADLPPGSYMLRVGLYLPWQRDPRQGHRQQVWDAQGQPIGDYATLGTLRVRARSSQEPAHLLM